MIRRLLIFLVILSPAVWAAIQPDKVVSPGATGLGVAVDVAESPATGAGFLLNADVVSRPGMLQKRTGYTVFNGGGTIKAMSAVHGIYDEVMDSKTLIGIRQADSIVLGDYWNMNGTAVGDSVVDSVYDFVGTSPLGVPVYASEFGLEPSNDIGNWPLNFRPFEQHFAQTNDFLVYCDGHSPPSAFTIVDAFTKSGSNWAKDTFSFAPNVRPLSLEAPGVLRPFAINDTYRGSLTGVFQYAVSFFDPDSGTVSAVISNMGLPSIEVPVEDGVIFLTCFPIYPFDWDDRADTTTVRIYRKNLEQSGPWMILDTIFYFGGSSVWYLDSIPDVGLTGIYDDTLGTEYVDSVATPGAPWIAHTSFPSGYDQDLTWLPATSYYFCLSYYDPITGMESPIGSKYRYQTHDTTAGGDQPIGYLALPIQNWHEHAKHMRVYVSLADGSVVGGGDTTVWYMWAQVDLDTLNTRVTALLVELNEVIIGVAHDTAIASGLTRHNMVDGYWQDFLRDNQKWDVIFDDAGGPVVLPPVIEPLDAVLSKMVFANGRLWGIGDQLFPSRLYYSSYDALNDWGHRFLEMDQGDGDVLVDVQSVPVGAIEALVALKHRKTFLISGYDVDYDLTVNLIDDGVGALSSSLVAKHRDVLYFVDRELRVRRMAGAEKPTDISRGIWGYCKSLFTDSLHYNVDSGRVYPAENPTAYSLADVWIDKLSVEEIRARAMIYGDEVLFVNQDDGRALAYNTISNAWSLSELEFPKPPRGTFMYDTLSDEALFGLEGWLFYLDDDDTGFYRSNDTVFDDGSVWNKYVTAYRSPYFGDDYHIIRLQRVDFTMTGNASMVAIVYDEDGDSLASGTFTVSSSDKFSQYSVYFPQHQGKRLCFELKDTATNTGWRLHDMTVHRKLIGVDRAM